MLAVLLWSFCVWVLFKFVIFMHPQKCLQIGRSFVIVTAGMNTNKVLVATINKSKAVSPKTIYNNIYNTDCTIPPLNLTAD